MTNNLPEEEIRRLLDIGLALMEERDLDRLLERILSASRELATADAGAIFLASSPPSKSGQPAGASILQACHAQNDSVELPPMAPPGHEGGGIAVPVSPESLAGYVAVTGLPLMIDDAYELPADLPYRFQPSIDHALGYRTRSVLVVPLKKRSGAIIGALQLFNRKRDPRVRLTKANVESQVLPFNSHLAGLTTAFGAIAAVAVENSRLLAEVQTLADDIQRIFDAFVAACSAAIEQRDPATRGHSERVSAITLALAGEVNATGGRAFAGQTFSEAELRELRYGSKLHDFGKIGVRESLLTKATRLDPWHLRHIQLRLALHVSEAGPDSLAARHHARLQRCLELCNDPAIPPAQEILPEERVSLLHQLTTLTWATPDGNRLPVMDDEEHECLSLRAGSLTPSEFAAVREHARLSHDFLSRIPWTPDLAAIPRYGRNHHEKLDGSGYPDHLRNDEISMALRLLTVADVFDALTASDRPYKRSLSPQAALEILRRDAAAGGVDGVVVEMLADLLASGRITVPGH